MVGEQQEEEEVSGELESPLIRQRTFSRHVGSSNRAQRLWQ